MRKRMNHTWFLLGLNGIINGIVPCIVTSLKMVVLQVDASVLW